MSQPVAYTPSTTQSFPLTTRLPSMTLLVNVDVPPALAISSRTIALIDSSIEEGGKLITGGGTGGGGATTTGDGIGIVTFLIVVPTSCLLYTSPSPRDRQKSR